MSDNIDDEVHQEPADALVRPFPKTDASKFVVIARVGAKDPAQMDFAENDDVIEAFAADRAD